MAAGLGPVYFTDENALGLGKLLRRSGRDDVLYAGHEELREVPLGTLDLDWMPVVAQRELIVLTRGTSARGRPSFGCTWSTASDRCGSVPSRTWGRVSKWSSSSSTSPGFGARSSSAVLARGHLR